MAEIFATIDAEKDYYSMYLSNRLFKLINYVIYISTTYKYAKHYIPDLDEYMDDRDMNDVFVYGRLQKCKIGSQEHLPSPEMLALMNDFIAELDKFINFKAHKQIITNLLSK